MGRERVKTTENKIHRPGWERLLEEKKTTKDFVLFLELDVEFRPE
jgi:hypothetical protein